MMPRGLFPLLPFCDCVVPDAAVCSAVRQPAWDWQLPVTMFATREAFLLSQASLTVYMQVTLEQFQSLCNDCSVSWWICALKEDDVCNSFCSLKESRKIANPEEASHQTCVVSSWEQK